MNEHRLSHFRFYGGWMMLFVLAVLIQSPTIAPVSVELWEIAKGVLLTLSTAGVVYLVRSQRASEIAIRLLEIETWGKDGNNGHKSKIKEFDRRLDLIENRNNRIDAVTEAERQQWSGPERRQQVRRFRDKEFPNPLDENPDTEK